MGDEFVTESDLERRLKALEKRIEGVEGYCFENDLERRVHRLEAATFIAFVGMAYYPSGGAEDTHRIFSNQAEAVAWCEGKSADWGDWGHVAKLTDTKLEIVWKKEGN